LRGFGKKNTVGNPVILKPLDGNGRFDDFSHQGKNDPNLSVITETWGPSSVKQGRSCPALSAGESRDWPTSRIPDGIDG